MNKTLMAWILSIITLLGSVPAIADITMGVFPRRPVAVTHKSFKPLADKLAAELGEKVEIVVAKDFPEFWKGVAGKSYDIVHYNQYHYIRSKKDFGYQVVAVNEEFGEKDIAGALVVRSDSGINSVADLKGKTILFGGGKKAMGSYIAPTAILKKAGLEEGKDYNAVFAKNPPGAIIAVFNKAADAGGSGDVILKTAGVSTQIDVAQVKILATGERFIHLTWAVKGDMPADKVAKITSVMTGLKGKDDAILDAAKVTNFHAAKDADFAKVREITKFAIGEDL